VKIIFVFDSGSQLIFKKCDKKNETPEYNQRFGARMGLVGATRRDRGVLPSVYNIIYLLLS
jgi:hypothetical protein